MQSVIRFLLPREDHFYDFLERQAVVAHKGAHALRSFKDGDVARVRDAVQLLEHEGDKIVHEMEEALAKTFVTPIDREDLQKLSSELDDVLDLMNGDGPRRGALRRRAADRADDGARSTSSSDAPRCSRTTMPHLRKHQYKDLVESARASPQARERRRRRLPRRGERPVSRRRHRRQATPSRKGGARGSRERDRRSPTTSADTLTNLAVKHG